MRIAIDYRVMSTDAADRGMGRYTQQQLAAVLEHDRENEYLVLLFPECRTDVIARSIGERTERRAATGRAAVARARHPRVPRPIVEVLSRVPGVDHRAGRRRYHATTPFIAPVVPDFDAVPVVATLYDLIPLIYPHHYFGPAAGRLRAGHAEYLRGLQLISRADRLIAISASALADARAYLGYPSEHATVAYPAVDRRFRPLPDATVRAAPRTALEARVSRTGPS